MKTHDTGTIAFPVLRWVGLLWTVVVAAGLIFAFGAGPTCCTCVMSRVDPFAIRARMWWWKLLVDFRVRPVSSLAAGIFWSVDIGWRLVTGRFLVGGTGIHVEHAGTALGEAAFQLSHRSSNLCCCGPCGKSVTTGALWRYRRRIAAGLFVAVAGFFFARPCFQ